MSQTQKKKVSTTVSSYFQPSVLSFNWIFFKDSKYIFLPSLFLIVQPLSYFLSWVILILVLMVFFLPCSVELNNLTSLISTSPNIWGHTCFSGSQGWLTAVAGAYHVPLSFQGFLIGHLLQGPFTHSGFPSCKYGICEKSHFYFLFYHHDFVTLLSLDCCFLKSLKIEQHLSIFVFLMASTMEHMSVTFEWTWKS